MAKRKKAKKNPNALLITAAIGVPVVGILGFLAYKFLVPAASAATPDEASASGAEGTSSVPKFSAPTAKTIQARGIQVPTGFQRVQR